MTHEEFHHQMNAYLAGGLSDAERAALAAHAAGCPACAAALEQAEAADRELDELFADARPDEGLEDRVVARLRAVRRPPMVLHPMVRRAAVGVAAAILLGGVGFVVTQAEQGEFPLLSFLDQSGSANVAAAAPALSQVERENRSSHALLYGEVAELTKSRGGSTAAGVTAPDEMARRFVEDPVVQNLWRESNRARGLTRTAESGEVPQGHGGVAWYKPSEPGATPNVSANTPLDRGAVADSKALGVETVKDLSDEMSVARVESDTAAQVSAGDAAAAKRHFGSVPAQQQKNEQEVILGTPLTLHDYYNKDATVAGKPDAVSAGVTAAVEESKFKPQEVFAYKEAQQPKDEYDVILLPTDDAGGQWGAASEGRPGGGEGFGFRNGPGGSADRVVASDLMDKRLKEQARPIVEQLSKSEESLAGQKDGAVQELEQLTESRLGDRATGAEAVDRFTDSPDFSLQQSSPAQARAAILPAPAGAPAAEKAPAPAEVTKLAAVAQPSDPGADPATDRQPKPAPDPAPAPAPDPAPPANDQKPNVELQRNGQQSIQSSSKIIRNGEMSFEVDGFDSSVMQITKIAAEEGGFIATTQSDKLPNGKVQGSVVVRVPPQRLDTLVLKLRGLGDLKSSRIAATDVTKQYTDLASQLRAAETMEKRLRQIIEGGKGEVKDLLEAEKQLGVWLERIERLTGEIKYYENLISLSTLTVSLVERDIRTSALLSESEQINMGVEADDVEKARAEALKAIEEAKGRIVESDLKTHDAGQYAATIVADVSPDAAGQVTDRLKQIGRVARLEVQRRRQTAEGTAPAPGARIERADTRLQLSIYNLANVAPRNTTTLNLAAEDVEKAYRAILEQVASAGGRVVNSQLTKPTPEQTTGTVTFEAPSEVADVLLGAVRGAGEVMRLDSTTNLDTQNSTDAKRGFSVQIQSLATVPPRETTTLRLAARDVPGAFATLRDAVAGAGGRVLTSQLTEQDLTNVTGQLDFEVRRESYAAVDNALADAGVVLSRNVNRSADAQNTVDSKVMLQVAFVDERTVPPRETVTLNLAVDDVPTKYEALLEALRGIGARLLVSTIDQQDPNNTTARLEFDVRRENRAAADKALADAGNVFGRSVARPAEGQPALDDKVRLAVSLGDVDNLPPRETTTLGLEVTDVDGTAGAVEAAALALGGRKVDSDWAQEPGGRTVARVVLDVPQARAGDLLAAARREGRVLTVQREQNPSAPDGPFARARLSLTVATEDPIVQRDQGLGASVRAGLSTSIEWLLRSVTLIVIGLCLVAPWALILWLGYRLLRARRRRTTTTTTTTSPGSSPPPPTAPPTGGPMVSPVP